MRRFKTYLFILVGMITVQLTSCTPSGHKEMATVKQHYSGCFVSEDNKLTIYCKGVDTMARLEKNGKVLLNTKISMEQMKSFNSFIAALQTMDGTGFCTSTESWLVTTEDATIDKIDRSCSWGGFQYLKRTMFGLERN